VRESFVRQGVRNLEAVELGLREALLRDGRRLLEQLLTSPDLNIPDNTSRPGEKCHADRPVEVRTLFGNFDLPRNYFYNAAQQKGRAPLDEALGLIHGFSPALRRLASLAAARQGYAAASYDLEALAGIKLEGRQIQRLVSVTGPQIGCQLEAGATGAAPIPVLYIEVDGTGVPMVPAELAGRKGKQPDGSAKTQEAKLGVIFTQTRCDADGLPQRDYASTTYVGGFETAEDFGLRVRREALRRGSGRAGKMVFIADGAEWAWNLKANNFRDAVEILDLYHALERLHELCQGLFPAAEAEARTTAWFEQLKNNEVALVIAAARQQLAELGPQPDDKRTGQIAYFERHQHRMQYKTYRDAGWYYGSGVIEAGCKAVIGQRLKNSGMFWTEVGATNILNLRCALSGNRWDECWDRLHDSQHLQIRAVA
jgi:hypothetical protein